MKPSPHRSSPSRRVLLACALGASGLLGGCCTTALWGCTATDGMMVTRKAREEGKGNPIFDSHADWRAWSIGRRVLLTPVALGLDVLTFPNQLGELLLGPTPRMRRAIERDSAGS